MKINFFRTFNSVYSKSKEAHSELVSVELLKSCLPFLLYASEAIPLSKTAVNMLDNCVNVALYKIFGVSSSNTNSMRQYLDLPKLHVLIEMRKVKFMEKLHLIPNLKTVLNVAILDWF